MIELLVHPAHWAPRNPRALLTTTSLILQASQIGEQDSAYVLPVSANLTNGNPAAAMTIKSVLVLTHPGTSHLGDPAAVAIGKIEFPSPGAAPYTMRRL